MANTIPGGAYFVNGRYVNSEGVPIAKKDATTFADMAVKREQDLQATEVVIIATATKQDPTSRAAMALLVANQQQQVASVPPSTPATGTESANATGGMV